MGVNDVWLLPRSFEVLQTCPAGWRSLLSPQSNGIAYGYIATEVMPGVPVGVDRMRKHSKMPIALGR